MKKFALVLLGVGLAVSLAACGAAKNQTGGTNTATPAPAPGTGTATTPPQASVSEPVTIDAQALYKKNCVTCHGNNMEGGAGPNLQKVGGRLSMDKISAQITNGGGGMPPFKGKLKDDEITALAAWLSTMK